MNTRNPAHAQIILEHSYDAPPHIVYAAWADENTKSLWFKGPRNWKLINRSLDLTVGGTELFEGRFDNGSISTYIAQYHEIIPNGRLVYASDIYINNSLHSVSLVTVEFLAQELKTNLRFTEQLVFLDGTTAAVGAAEHRAGHLAHLSRLASLLSTNTIQPSRVTAIYSSLNHLH